MFTSKVRLYAPVSVKSKAGSPRSQAAQYAFVIKQRPGSKEESARRSSGTVSGSSRRWVGGNPAKKTGGNSGRQLHAPKKSRVDVARTKEPQSDFDKYSCLASLKSMFPRDLFYSGSSGQSKPQPKKRVGSNRARGSNAKTGSTVDLAGSGAGDKSSVLSLMLKDMCSKMTKLENDLDQVKICQKNCCQRAVQKKSELLDVIHGLRYEIVSQLSKPEDAGKLMEIMLDIGALQNEVSNMMVSGNCSSVQEPERAWGTQGGFPDCSGHTLDTVISTECKCSACAGRSELEISPSCQSGTERKPNSGSEPRKSKSSIASSGCTEESAKPDTEHKSRLARSNPDTSISHKKALRKNQVLSCDDSTLPRKRRVEPKKGSPPNSSTVNISEKRPLNNKRTSSVLLNTEPPKVKKQTPNSKPADRSSTANKKRSVPRDNVKKSEDISSAMQRKPSTGSKVRTMNIVGDTPGGKKAPIRNSIRNNKKWEETSGDPRERTRVAEVTASPPATGQRPDGNVRTPNLDPKPPSRTKKLEPAGLNRIPVSSHKKLPESNQITPKGRRNASKDAQNICKETRKFSKPSQNVAKETPKNSKGTQKVYKVVQIVSKGTPNATKGTPNGSAGAKIISKETQNVSEGTPIVPEGPPTVSDNIFDSERVAETDLRIGRAPPSRVVGEIRTTNCEEASGGPKEKTFIFREKERGSEKPKSGTGREETEEMSVSTSDFEERTSDASKTGAGGTCEEHSFSFCTSEGNKNTGSFCVGRPNILVQNSDGTKVYGGEIGKPAKSIFKFRSPAHEIPSDGVFVFRASEQQCGKNEKANSARKGNVTKNSSSPFRHDISNKSTLPFSKKKLGDCSKENSCRLANSIWNLHSDDSRLERLFGNYDPPVGTPPDRRLDTDLDSSRSEIPDSMNYNISNKSPGVPGKRGDSVQVRMLYSKEESLAAEKSTDAYKTVNESPLNGAFDRAPGVHGKEVEKVQVSMSPCKEETAAKEESSFTRKTEELNSFVLPNRDKVREVPSVGSREGNTETHEKPYGLSDVVTVMAVNKVRGRSRQGNPHAPHTPLWYNSRQNNSYQCGDFATLTRPQPSLPLKSLMEQLCDGDLDPLKDKTADVKHDASSGQNLLGQFHCVSGIQKDNSKTEEINRKQKIYIYGWGESGCKKKTAYEMTGNLPGPGRKRDVSGLNEECFGSDTLNPTLETHFASMGCSFPNKIQKSDTTIDRFRGESYEFKDVFHEKSSVTRSSNLGERRLNVYETESEEKLKKTERNVGFESFLRSREAVKFLLENSPRNQKYVQRPVSTNERKSQRENLSKDSGCLPPAENFYGKGNSNTLKLNFPGGESNWKHSCRESFGRLNQSDSSTFNLDIKEKTTLQPTPTPSFTFTRRSKNQTAKKGEQGKAKKFVKKETKTRNLQNKLEELKRNSEIVKRDQSKSRLPEVLPYRTKCSSNTLNDPKVEENVCVQCRPAGKLVKEPRRKESWKFKEGSVATCVIDRNGEIRLKVEQGDSQAFCSQLNKIKKVWSHTSSTDYQLLR